MEAADKMQNCKIVFSTFNYEKVGLIHSIHTFYIEKINNVENYSYNGYVNEGTLDLKSANLYHSINFVYFF